MGWKQETKKAIKKGKKIIRSQAKGWTGARDHFLDMTFEGTSINVNAKRKKTTKKRKRKR